MRKIIIFLILAVLSAPPRGLANDQDIPYGLRIPYRIVRGVTNFALSWTEIFLRPIGEHQTESFGEAVGMGASNTMIRMSAGFTDIFTCWVPDMQMLEVYPDWQGWPYLFHWS